jgi:hypothetical protein
LTTANQLARTQKKAKPSAAARPSTEEQGVRGLPPTTAIHLARMPKKKAKRCVHAKRSGEGGFGGLPRLRQSDSHARRRKSSRAQRPGRAKRIREGRGSPPATAIQLGCTPRKAKPSAAARPSAAKKGGLGVYPDYDTTKHAHAQKKANFSGHAERSGEGGFGGLVSPDYGNGETRSSLQMNTARMLGLHTQKDRGTCPGVGL